MSKNDTGVTYETKAKKYRAYIHIGGRKICLGYFQTYEGARQARESAILNGEYNLLNFLKSRINLTTTTDVKYDDNLIIILPLLSYDISNLSKMSFSTFAINKFYQVSGRGVKDFSVGGDVSEITNLDKVATVFSDQIQTSPIFRKWAIDGDSINSISAQTLLPVRMVKSNILMSIDKMFAEKLDRGELNLV